MSGWEVPEPGPRAHRTGTADATGRPAARTYEYIRHGTSTPFPALKIITRHITTAHELRHRRQEFLAFLNQVARAYLDQQLHLVMENYALHKTLLVLAWLAENPRFRVHFTPTPTSASWLDLVAVCFGLIERQALHRTDLASVADLNKRIRAFVTAWNDRCRPFVRTKASTKMLKKANRPTSAKTGH